MEFEVDPAFKDNLLAKARPRLKRACAGLVTYIKTVTLSKGRRGQGDVLTEGMPPYLGVGQLRNSVIQREKEGDPNTQQVGSPTLQGRIQEKGVNITSGKLMTIPRTDEAIRHLQKPGATARTFPRPLVMIPSRRSGVFYLVEKRRSGKRNAARTEIHFILAHHVHIPPHPWLIPSLHAYGPQMLQTMSE